MDSVVMDFSHIYREEDFSYCDSLDWIDCTNILGTNCFCNEEAQNDIRHLIASYSPHGIHFIDSGNFHYVSKLWIEKIKEPYSLVIFDHHPDMQTPRFDGMLSCGGWVKSLIETHSWLQKVYIIGSSEALKEEINGYEDILLYVSEADLHSYNQLYPFEFTKGEKIYISIDLDVLASSEVSTNWDQGSMSFGQLSHLLSIAFEQSQVIGVDVCGGDNNIVGNKEQQNRELNKRLHDLILSLARKDIWQK